MVFKDSSTNSTFTLTITNHINDRYNVKGNETFRIPPKFNLHIFKSIVNKINNILKFNNEYIVVNMEYDSKERIHFLLKIEDSLIEPGTYTIVLISSLISKNSILPYKDVSINKRILIETSFPEILLEIENEKKEKKRLDAEREEKSRLRAIERKKTAYISPLNGTGTGLKIIKKGKV